jgi:hypothetical protein
MVKPWPFCQTDTTWEECDSEDSEQPRKEENVCFQASETGGYNHGRVQ